MNRHCVFALFSGALLVAGCSSSQRGMQCQGEVKTLPGQSIGQTSAIIVDNIYAFTVVLPKNRIESGLLRSADHQRYVPSAVTKEGYLAQRLSSSSFCIIDADKNQYTLYRCQ